MSNLSTLPKGDSAWLLRKAIERIMEQVSVLETNIGASTSGNSANTQIIFNDNGTLRGDAGLVYNKTTDTLTAGSAVVTGAATITGDLTVDTSTLKVDSTNDRVGIGTATPSSLLALNQASGAYSLNMDGGGYGTMASFGVVNVGVNNNAYIGTVGNNDFLIQVANSTRATFDQNGHFNLANGNVVMTTSGKGIDFSATAGTGTSELLNDYEEGTWTATLTGTVANPTIPVTATGRYTKIGRVVSVSAFFSSVITTGASGRIQITGLPFTNNSSITAVGTAAFNGMATFTGSPFASLATSDTTLIMFSSNSAASYAAVNFNAGTSQDLWVSLNYTVA